jgi:uncharacterized membrane protein YjgN (DUF898 family)
MSTAQPPTEQSHELPRSSQATTILVLGIISIICCQIAGPIAWYMGRQELNRIQAGAISAQDEGTTKAGMILGIISSILLVLALLWVVFFGGLAFLAALAGQAQT